MAVCYIPPEFDCTLCGIDFVPCGDACIDGSNLECVYSTSTFISSSSIFTTVASSIVLVNPALAPTSVMTLSITANGTLTEVVSEPAPSTTSTSQLLTLDTPTTRAFPSTSTLTSISTHTDSLSHSAPSPASTSSLPAGPSTLTTASKAGIGVSAAFFAFVVCILLPYLWWRRRRRPHSSVNDSSLRRDALNSTESSEDESWPHRWRNALSIRRPTTVTSEKTNTTREDISTTPTAWDERQRAGDDIPQMLPELDGRQQADVLNLSCRSLSGNEGSRYYRETGWEDVLGTRVELEANEAREDQTAT